MNIFLIASTVFCMLLLLFIAYAFINNSDLKLINEASTPGTSSEIDTSSVNETANETENQ
jgi:hypothetical protein